MKNAKGRIQGTLSTGRLDDDDEHTLTFSEQADGSIRILCGSQYDETFTGREGEIATLQIKIADDVDDGEYPIELKNMRLSETDISKYYDTESVVSRLVINSYMPGDINGDGIVNVSDYIGIANHILGSTPTGFIEKAADVNEDNVINVSDYIGVANIILTGSPFGNSNNVKAARVKAKTTDLSAKDNVIYVEPLTVDKGTQATLSFMMKNSAAIRGFQFDLYLPDGVTAVKNAKGRIQGSLSSGRLPEDDEHTLTIQAQADGAIRFLCGSQYDETFTGHEGEIATLLVNIANDMADGEYPIILKGMRLSETDISKFYDSDNVETTLTIKGETDLPYISIESFTIDRGEKAKLMIDLINSNDEIRVIYFNYKLPNGLHVIEVGTKMDRAWRSDNESEGWIGVRSSKYYSPIEGLDGPVLEMDLEADQSFIGGSIILSNILFLKLDETEYSQPDLIYSLKGDAIKNISNRGINVFTPLYNLAGQQTTHPRKGVYIQGGKKVVVK